MAPPPVKILVVDDEVYISASVTMALGRGYQVDAISESGEAFEVLRENSRGFDIVIADHLMPGLLGADLIKKLQGTAFHGKWILLSGHLSPELEKSYHELGVKYVIPKPFDVAQLRNAVAATAQGIVDHRN